ncbi:MAG: chromate transporter [Clostridiales bacterium]|nr:chromate transporter [Clostridiales bacterium]
MIYLQLFLAFLKIGAVAFGGGYAMIPLVEETVTQYGWLTSEELLNYIAISESTPGPIAVNIATFVGSSQGGLLGAFLATLGIILPAYFIILLISIFAKNILSKKPIQAVIGGIKPSVIGLIIAASITMFMSVVCNFSEFGDSFKFDFWALVIIAIIATISFTYYKLKKKPISSIYLIITAGILGIIFYGI